MDTERTNAKQRIKYAIALADRHKHELGFLPRTIYAPMHNAGRLLIAEENTDPCGFLLLGPKKKTWRIYQTCVQTDARLQDHGSDLVEQIIQQAIDASVHQIQLWCAADLPANAFWKSLGFQPISTRHKRKEKNRLQIGYRYELPNGTFHRETLAADTKWQTEKRLLNVLGTFQGNRDAINKRIAKREE